MRDQNVSRGIMDALEASIFAAPTNPGLSVEELVSVLSKLGFYEGEIRDAISEIAWVQIQPDESGKYMIAESYPLHVEKVANYPAPAATMDFVTKHLQDQLRKVGKQNYGMERSVLVSRCLQEGFRENEAETAITLLFFQWRLITESGRVKIRPGQEDLPPYTALVAQSSFDRDRSAFFKTVPLVAEVIARRTDGREKSPEPLAAFESRLDKLGRANFKVWWYSTRRELANLNPPVQPKSYLLLAAALC